MTERQAKLTRLPIMFLRNNPSFFSNCWRMPYTANQSSRWLMMASVLAARLRCANEHSTMQLISQALLMHRNHDWIANGCGSPVHPCRLWCCR